MKSKDQTLLEEAYEKISEASALKKDSSLLSPGPSEPDEQYSELDAKRKSSSLSDIQAMVLVSRYDKIKAELKKVKDIMADPEYEFKYPNRDQIGLFMVVKDLEKQIQAIRKKYYGE